MSLDIAAVMGFNQCGAETGRREGMTVGKRADLSERIRKAILASGMSVNQFARKAGVSQPQISRFLKGERTLTLPVAEKVFEALGFRLVSPEESTE